jgi:hypothetical protein
MTENHTRVKQKKFPYWHTKLISYFDVGKHTIKVDLSSVSARESIFVDEVLVSKKRNWQSQKSIHEFEIEGQSFEIVIDIKNSFAGPIEVTLKQDGADIDGDRWVYPYSPATILGLVCATAGFMAAILFNTVW